MGNLLKQTDGPINAPNGEYLLHLDGRLVETPDTGQPDCCCGVRRAYKYRQCCGASTSSGIWVAASALGVYGDEQPCRLITIRLEVGGITYVRCYFFTGEVSNNPETLPYVYRAFAAGDGCTSIPPAAGGAAICEQGRLIGACPPCTGACCLGTALPYCADDNRTGIPSRRCNLGNSYRIQSTRERIVTVSGFRDAGEYPVHDLPPQWEGGPLQSKCFGWQAGVWSHQRIKTELDATWYVRPDNSDPNNPGGCGQAGLIVHSARLIVENYYKTAQFLRFFNTYIDPSTGQDTGLPATYSRLEGVDPIITDERRDTALRSPEAIGATGFSAYFVFGPEAICHSFPRGGLTCCNDSEINAWVTAGQTIYQTDALTSLYDCLGGYSMLSIRSRQASCRGSLDPMPTCETLTETTDSIRYSIQVLDETYCDLATDIPPNLGGGSQPLIYPEGTVSTPEVPGMIRMDPAAPLYGCAKCRQGAGL